MNISKVIEEVAINLLNFAVMELPKDVKKALKKAYKDENSEIGKIHLENILTNIKMAEKNRKPLCQDTGIIIFYVKAGAKTEGLEKIEKSLKRATEIANKKIPLRPNAVNPFTGKNSGNNIGRYIPHINWDIVSGDTIEITALPKGGGSENVSMSAMLIPIEGLNGFKKFVINAILNAGGKGCPPYILGIGVGGGLDISSKLAKKALLRPIDKSNPDPFIAKLERQILEAGNMTGLGPMGSGGKTTLLGVNIEYAYRHPASYPVTVNFQCWAARKASARIFSDGTYEFLTHDYKK